MSPSSFRARAQIDCGPTAARMSRAAGTTSPRMQTVSALRREMLRVAQRPSIGTPIARRLGQFETAAQSATRSVHVEFLSLLVIRARYRLSTNVSIRPPEPVYVEASRLSIIDSPSTNQQQHRDDTAATNRSYAPAGLLSPAEGELGSRGAHPFECALGIRVSEIHPHFERDEAHVVVRRELRL
jgi:hypothetical protein